jgi:hypothetical protein
MIPSPTLSRGSAFKFTVAQWQSRWPPPPARGPAGGNARLGPGPAAGVPVTVSGDSDRDSVTEPPGPPGRHRECGDLASDRRRTRTVTVTQGLALAWVT